MAKKKQPKPAPDVATNAAPQTYPPVVPPTRKYKCKHTNMIVAPSDPRFVECGNSGCSAPDRARRLADERDDAIMRAARMAARARKAARTREVKTMIQETIETGGLFAGLVPEVKLNKHGKVIPNAS